MSVRSANKLRHASILRCHLEQNVLRGHGYLHLGRNTYVADPLLMAAQLAKQASLTPGARSDVLPSKAMRRKLPAILLTVVMTELMGSYRLSPSAPDGFVEAPPLFTLQELRELVEENRGFTGRSLLEFAALHALEGSASPAETALALFETLPLTCGGMGLSKSPVLNRSVQTQFMQHVRALRPDQLFEEERIVIEYNGSYHAGERANSDDRRRLELEGNGLLVKSINREQLLDPLALEEALCTVVEAIGTQGRRPADYAARRRDLRSLVFEACHTRCAENTGQLLPPGFAPVTRS
ncbi:MAG: hypothetical protein ACI36W_04475 [Coriobacteriales bacterium]